MPKVVVISGTARPGSNTLKVSKIYLNLLKELGAEGELLDLNQLPGDLVASILGEKKNEKVEEYAQRFIIPNRYFIIVMPEYNGSFPGLLKVFLDSIHPKFWNDKYVCLVGVSVGRAGNLRGMEHLTGVLNYLKMHVFHSKLPISVIDKLLNESGGFSSAEQEKVCREQVKSFLHHIEGR